MPVDRNQLPENNDIGKTEEDSERHGYREQLTDIAVLGEKLAEDAFIPQEITDRAHSDPFLHEFLNHAP